MSTLLLRISAPWQSWGTSSRFPNRYTNKAPSKSAIIGMIAAAMGIRREEEISHFSSLGYAVRVDQVGHIESDSQNATQWKRDTGKKNSSLPRGIRYYLSDFIFVVGIEGDKDFLEEISYSLKNPKFHLFLGRKSCVPDQPMVLGIKDDSLIESLHNTPWQASTWYKKENEEFTLEILRDGTIGESGDIVNDIPVSFSPLHRDYAKRTVVREKPLKISHDPFSLIEGI